METKESKDRRGMAALSLALMLGTLSAGWCDEFENARARLNSTFSEYMSETDDALGKIRAGAESIRARQAESFLIEVKGKKLNAVSIPETQVALAGRKAEFAVETLLGTHRRKFTLLILKDEGLYRLQADSSMSGGRLVEQYFLPGRPVEMLVEFPSGSEHLEITIRRAPDPRLLSDEELAKIVQDAGSGLEEIHRKAERTKRKIRWLDGSMM